MKKIFFLVLISTIAVFMMVGCAGKVEKTENETDGTTVAEESAPAEVGEVAEEAEVAEPAEASAPTKDFGKAYAGKLHSMAIKNDGTVWTWGGNNVGQLGNGEITLYNNDSERVENHDQLKPVKVMENGLTGSVGENFSLVVTKDHELFGFGSNRSGQLGLEGIEYSATPVKIMEEVISVSSDDFNSAVIKEDNSLWIFGSKYVEDNYFNEYGEVTEYTNIPYKILEGIKEVSLCSYYGMALANDGSLYMWGEPEYLGEKYATDDPNAPPIPEPVKIMDDVMAISGTGQTPMVIKNDGKLFGWGYNAFSGKLGIGSEEFYFSAPQLIDEDVKIINVSNSANMYIKKDGSLWAMGEIEGMIEEFSQIGVSGGSIGSVISTYGNKPTKIMDNAQNVNGKVHYLIVDNDNNLWGLGANNYGKIGDGTETTYTYTIDTTDEYPTKVYEFENNNEREKPVMIMNLD